MSWIMKHGGMRTYGKARNDILGRESRINPGKDKMLRNP